MQNNQIADFVVSNQLDGVDIDFEDNAAMDAGKVSHLIARWSSGWTGAGCVASVAIPS